MRYLTIASDLEARGLSTFRASICALCNREKRAASRNASQFSARPALGLCDLIYKLISRQIDSVKMSEEAHAAAVEQVTQEVKDVKLENGNAPGAANGTSNKPEDNAIPFKDTFKAFSKFGDPKSDGKQITLSQSDKWMKQAKVIDAKKITTTDTAIHFKKLKSVKLGIEDYQKFLDDLAKSKKCELDDIKKKLTTCGQPGYSSHVTKSQTAAAAVDRLTDTSKYTGSHKQRFDDSGKGKGIAGRKDLVDGSGYVSGYQHKDSYNKTH